MNLSLRLTFALPLSLLLILCVASTAQADPNSGPPTNLHHRFVVQQAKRRAAQCQPVRRHVGVWLSGGFERTVAEARRSPTQRPRRLFARQ
jgi:hypothetical protein